MIKRANIRNTGLPGLVRQVNLQSAARQMRRMEVFSKIELARELGISTTTMTKLFARLEGDDLIVKSPVADKSFGRPKILYQLSPALQVAVVVIDVETTTIAFSSLRAETPSEQGTCFATGTEARVLFRRIRTEFSNLRKKLGAPCCLVGVCIPGLIELGSGRSVLNPNLRWLEGMRPAHRIEKLLDLPALIMHEEMALCRAQRLDTDDSTDYIAMDFSAGVGMSVVSNGRHLSGTSGFAGEIGHIVMEPGGRQCGCGNRGCLETIASDRAFQAETGLHMDEALQRLADGDPGTIACAHQVLRSQATGIATVINIFNPENIFVCSRLATALPNYLETLRGAVEERALHLSFAGCTIDTTRDGKLKGALLQTIDQLIDQATTPET